MKKITTILMLLMLSMGATAQMHVTKTGSDFLTETQLKAGIDAATDGYYVALQIHAGSTFYVGGDGKAVSTFSTTGSTTWIIEKSGEKYVLKNWSGQYIKTLGANGTAATFTTNSSEALKFNIAQSTSTDTNMESGYVANKAIWYNVDGTNTRINTNSINGTQKTIWANNGSGCWTCLFTYEVTIKSTVDITFNITGDATKPITKTVASDATGDIAELLGYDTEFVTFSPATYNAAEGTTVNVTCTQNLPFKTDGTKYNMTLRGKYAKGNDLVSTVGGDALYDWTFTGDYLNGFKIFNVGQGKYIKSEDVDNSVAQFVEESEATTYFLAKSTYGDGSYYCLKIMGTEKNFLNARNDKLSTWLPANNANPIGDLGSTMTFTEKSYKDLVDNLVKPWMEATGTGYFFLTDASKQAITDAGYSADATNYTENEYNAIKAAFDNAEKKMPETGYYRIKNKVRSNPYIGYGEETSWNKVGLVGCSEDAAIKDASTLIKLEKSGDTYTLSIQGQYVTGQSQNNTTFPTSTDQSEAEPFTIVPQVPGYAAFVSSNNSDGKGSLHHAGWDGTSGIVRWEASADASQWLLEEANELSGGTYSLEIALTTIASKSYATTCLPFPVKLSEAAAYKVTLSGKKAVEEPIGDEIPANIPVLLISDASATLTATIQETTATVDCGALKGVCVKTAKADLQGETPVVLNRMNDKVGFYKLADGSSLSANRAYLSYEEGTTPTSAKAFFEEGFELGGNEATAIENIENGAFENGAVYNLQGQRVVKAQKGVFIQNGKKVVLK